MTSTTTSSDAQSDPLGRASMEWRAIQHGAHERSPSAGVGGSRHASGDQEHKAAVGEIGKALQALLQVERSDDEPTSYDNESEAGEDERRGEPRAEASDQVEPSDGERTTEPVTVSAGD